jgi:hypothetical protein
MRATWASITSGPRLFEEFLVRGPRLLVGSVVVEYPLGVLQRQRSEPGDLGGPGLGIGERADPVGHPRVECALRGEPFRGHQHASCPACTHQRRQPTDAPVVQRQTIFGDRELEVGIRGDDAQVADHR